MVEPDDLRGTEEERLARHILEQEGYDRETVNKVRKYVLNEPVSHYLCEVDSIIPAWEDVEDEQETYERAPDHIGCTDCGVMTGMKNTIFGREIWQEYRGLLDTQSTKD